MECLWNVDEWEELKMLYLIKSKKTGNVIVRTESFFNASYWYRKLPYKENYEFIRIKPRKSAI